jgi:BirA family biotin operon repressor/biotin-[acetyl-CoA-carboxylase] ligase
MRERVLALLQPGEFVSGELIGEELSISRTAVWKHIQTLKKAGYDIETVKNKGYLLRSYPEKPLKEEVERDLGTDIIGKEVELHASIDSTNRKGKVLARDRVEEGYVIVAEEQTEGKGRKSREWSSDIGGLWFSVVLYPELPLDRGMLVTMMASISVVQGVETFTGMRSEIKWPNDILLDGRKVCGILTEMDAEMDMIENMVVGIGLNVNNELKGSLRKIGVSLKDRLDKSLSRVELLRSILKAMDRNYTILKKGGHEDIRKMWMDLSNMVGREVSVDMHHEEIKGKVLSIDETGGLVLETDDGERKVVSGDLRYI